MERVEGGEGVEERKVRGRKKKRMWRWKKIGGGIGGERMRRRTKEIEKKGKGIL